jgi:hypothetical protein
MHRAARLALTVSIAIVAFGATGQTEDRLALRVTPAITTAPANLAAIARIAPDPGNRVLRIEADSGAFFRSSDVQLDGESAPRVMEVRFRDLPGGEYEVRALLLDHVGQQTTARRSVIVMPRPGER